MKDYYMIPPHKAYVYKLGKTVKDLTKAEMSAYRKKGEQYSRLKRQGRPVDHLLESVGADILPLHKAYLYSLDVYSTAGLTKEEHVVYISLEYKNRNINTLLSWFKLACKRTLEVGTFEEVIGCSVEELKVHIESKWLDGMTWLNWGKGAGENVWHIDHITAIKAGGRNHYTNLQPLWAGENIRKSRCSEYITSL